MPPKTLPKSPPAFIDGAHGEWSDTIMSSVPSASPCHSRSRLSSLRIGGHAANSRRAVGDVFGREGQVVRACLSGDPHAGSPGIGQHRQHAGAGHMHDVYPRACVLRGVDDKRDGVFLRGVGPSRQKGLISAATWDWTVRDDVVALRVHQQHRIDGGDARDRAPELVGAQMTEVRIARVGEEALEAPHPRRGQIAELTEIAGDHAAPERDIDLTVASRRFAFAPQRIDRGGHRVAVQRHVDQRGDAGRRRGCRRGGEALPVGTRLVDVHVRVDEARHAGPPCRRAESVQPPDNPRRSGPTARITPSATATAAGRSWPSMTARSARMTRSTTAEPFVEVARQLRPHDAGRGPGSVGNPSLWRAS